MQTHREINATEMASNNLVNDSTSEETLRTFSKDLKLKRLDQLLAEFNLFDVLSIARSELQHSRVVAWLLDPHGSHGLGDAFLRGFLRQAALTASGVGINTPMPTDIDGWKLDSAEVFRERHNIDILVIDECNELVCLIENKIDSGEHSNQLCRYLRTVRRTYQTLTPLPVFLTPSGTRPADAQDAKEYASLGYESIAGLIGKMLETGCNGIRASVVDFLKQYELTLRRSVLEIPSDIDRLAYEIYSEHQEAIDLIVQTKSKLSAPNWDIIESAIDRLAPDLRLFSRSNTLLKYVSRSLEEVAELRKGEDEGGLITMFDFLFYQESVRLRLIVGTGPRTTRKRLYDLTPTEYRRSQSQNFDDREFRMYWKGFLSRADCNPLEPEETRAKAEKGIKEFYGQDYWLLVNAIRSEFGVTPIKRQSDLKGTE